MVTAHMNVDELSYEQARDELVAIVAKLEVGAVTLEESLELWERGEALAVRCQQILQGARERIAAPDHTDDASDEPDASEGSDA
jgi:exodeoxyribonuclease VII small subunit